MTWSSGVPGLVGRLFAEVSSVRRLLPSIEFARWLACLAVRVPAVLKRRSLGPVDESFGTSFRVRFGSCVRTLEGTGFGVVREILGSRCYGDLQDLAGTANVLDLGANAGVFSLLALHSSNGVTVHAVEIQREMVEICRLNLERAGFAGRFTIERAAVGGWASEFARMLRRQDPGLGAFDPVAYVRRVGRCALLKCDVEGAEFALFSGELSWLAAVDSMVIEYHPEHGDVTSLEARLRKAGFDVHREPHGVLGYLRATRRSPRAQPGAW